MRTIPHRSGVPPTRLTHCFPMVRHADQNLPPLPPPRPRTANLIWHHALTSPNTLHGIIPLVLGRYLSRTRAILPLVKDSKSVCCAANSFTDQYNPRPDPEDHDEEFWDNSNGRLEESRAPVSALMWTCRLSRKLARERYRLDITSLVQRAKEEGNWWSGGRPVFCPPPWERERYTYVEPWNTAMFWVLSQSRKRGVFADLEHVSPSIDPMPNDLLRVPPDELVTEADFELLASSKPESLSLLLDPGRVRGEEKGRLVYWKLLEVLVFELKRTPEQFQQWVCKKILVLNPVGREMPVVGVFAMGVGTWRNSEDFDD